MIKITADSTCDLSNELLQQFNVTLIPLHVLIDEQDYLDGVNITPTDIFDYVGVHNRTCSTAAINVFEYEQFFAQYAGEFEAVLHINLGSSFSSCHQNASIAAQSFENVYVFDSQNLSTGSGLFVVEAARLAKQGLSVQEILAQLHLMTTKVNASFVIDKMDYLKKGGRCTSLEAFGATLLKIKPSIEVVEGKMAVGKKYRGNFDRCIEKYVKERLSIEGINTSCIFITHSKCTPETVATVRTLIERHGQFDEIYETQAGCTISAHCGPNTLGILYKTK